VDIDFRNSEPFLCKSERKPLIPGDLQVVAEAEMELGIWCMDVSLHGRGLVKTLVDTGAASSSFSWGGVDKLGLSRASQSVTQLRGRIGALGSDNDVMELTHHFTFERNLNLSPQSNLLGVSIGTKKFVAGREDIALLEMLRQNGDQANGILGIDLFSMCSIVRITCNGPLLTLYLFRRNDSKREP